MGDKSSDDLARDYETKKFLREKVKESLDGVTHRFRGVEMSPADAEGIRKTFDDWYRRVITPRISQATEDAVSDWSPIGKTQCDFIGELADARPTGQHVGFHARCTEEMHHEGHHTHDHIRARMWTQYEDHIQGKTLHRGSPCEVCGRTLGE